MLSRNKSFENKKWGVGRTKEEIANAISFGIYKLKSQNVFTLESVRCQVGALMKFEIKAQSPKV